MKMIEKIKRKIEEAGESINDIEEIIYETVVDDEEDTEIFTHFKEWKAFIRTESVKDVEELYNCNVIIWTKKLVFINVYTCEEDKLLMTIVPRHPSDDGFDLVIFGHTFPYQMKDVS